MKRTFPALIISLTLLILIASCTSNQKKSETPEAESKDDYTVASYYFPNYHVDKRNKKSLGENWTEWELVKAAGPRFEGHRQPKVPAWGYTDEANPAHMEQKIDAAADHGIDAFIFDWYYYDDGLFLERGIEEGFFGAKNNRRIKFGLMWANHDWMDIFPVDSATLLSPDGPEVLYPGTITVDTWERMTDYVIETYFKHPSYWLIDNAPYFSIYDLTKFIRNFGSTKATIKGIEAFRKKVRDAGFGDLHLNAVVWGRTILPSEERIEVDDMGSFLKELGFTSTTSYVWIHHVQPDFPEQAYPEVQAQYFSYAENFSASIDLPYYPNVTMGWDSSPRTKQTENFSHLGYPFTGTLSNNTPENFREALLEMREYLDQHPGSGKIFNINCWNEWTEGSYLEPDTIHGMAYLEAIKEVFE